MTTLTAAPVGFWARAQATPEGPAVIASRQITRGELFALSNRLVHAVRALGLRPGDGIATVLPNSIEQYALYLAAMQAGWYFTPINWHLVGPEIAYIVNDAEAKVLVAGDRYAGAAQAAAAKLDLPQGSLLSVGERGPAEERRVGPGLTELQDFHEWLSYRSPVLRRRTR